MTRRARGAFLRRRGRRLRHGSVRNAHGSRRRRLAAECVRIILRDGAPKVSYAFVVTGGILMQKALEQLQRAFENLSASLHRVVVLPPGARVQVQEIAPR